MGRSPFQCGNLLSIIKPIGRNVHELKKKSPIAQRFSNPGSAADAAEPGIYTVYGYRMALSCVSTASQSTPENIIAARGLLRRSFRLDDFIRASCSPATAMGSAAATTARARSSASSSPMGVSSVKRPVR